MLFLKNNIVDKILGLSATPCRILEKNKNRTFDIYGNNCDLNVIYQRGILEAIEDNDIVGPKWSYFFVKENEIEKDLKKDSDGIEKTVYKLNDKGNQKMIKYIDQILEKSVYKKGILWFRSKKDVVKFYKFVNKNKLLPNIKLFLSFSTSNDKSEVMKKCNKLGISKKVLDTNLENFKNEKSNAIFARCI